MLTNEKERMLAMHVVRFPEALADAIADLLPNRLTEYLYELTDIFNSFYVECQVRHAISIQQRKITQGLLPLITCQPGWCQLKCHGR
jgi:arginyl-tRNA synthetase